MDRKMTNEINKRLQNIADTLYRMMELATVDQNNIHKAIEYSQQIEERLVKHIDRSVQNNIKSGFNQHNAAFKKACEEAIKAADELKYTKRKTYLTTIVVSFLISVCVVIVSGYMYVPSIEKIETRREELRRLEGLIKDKNIILDVCRDGQVDSKYCVNK